MFTAGGNNVFPNYFRLAFLGDSVLGIILREHFYKKYPKWNREELSGLFKSDKDNKILSIESNEIFFKISKNLKLMEYLKNRPIDYENSINVNATVLEALIGAIYLKNDLEFTKEFVKEYILEDEEIIKIENEYIKIKQL